jgi:hypothetical protein
MKRWIALVAPAFEALALFELATGAPVTAWLLHLAAAGLLAEALHTRAQGRGLVLAWFFAVVFPIFGVLAGVVVLLRAGRPGKQVTGESREQLRGRAADAALEGLKRAHRVGADLVPLAEALRDRDPLVRVAAVDALRDEDAPWAVRLLQRARDNEVYDVRFRAVEALGRISTRRLDEIAAARRALPSPDAHRRLATLCFDYADLAIDGDELVRTYLQQAIDHASQAQRASTQLDPSLVLLVARAAMKLGAFDKAQAAFSRVLADEPEHADARAGLAEALFAARDFAALELESSEAGWASR